MLVLGLQGSPRKKGNTNFLLSTFMQAAEKSGARTHTIDVCRDDGCVLEMILKDTHTCGNHPERFTIWADIAGELAVEAGG